VAGGVRLGVKVIVGVDVMVAVIVPVLVGVGATHDFAPGLRGSARHAQPTCGSASFAQAPFTRTSVHCCVP
jgi:hypothetical protein